MQDLKLINNKIVFWFRRDLRLDDNAGLYHALKSHEDVIPVFIFDINILSDLAPIDARIEFILQSLQKLQKELVKINSSFVIYHGDPVEIFSQGNPKSIYANQDYEPYAVERDNKIKSIISNTGGKFYLFKDQVIFEKDEVVKENGKPFTVFTPYMKKWKKILRQEDIRTFPSEKLQNNFWKTKPLWFPELNDLGFKKSAIHFPSNKIDVRKIKVYDKTRNFPALDGTTRLSVHLRFGTISIRKLFKIGSQNNETFMIELIWREFFMMILWHFPRVVNHSFKSSYDQIEWGNDEEKFKRWREGKTGFPIVDAGMRELNTTGYMNNRLRMITASFLCKDLHIDWRWGEAYFAEKLLDYELASNNGGWQWAAGTGCDAAPYFRIFNPDLQQQKFDPEMKYIKKWIPELRTNDYPDPIIDHNFSRQKTLDLYKAALKN